MEWINHKWKEGDKYDDGQCVRCKIIRSRVEYGGYQYFDPKTPLGTERVTLHRPVCAPEKTIQEMGITCHFN